MQIKFNMKSHFAVEFLLFLFAYFPIDLQNLPVLVILTES